MAKYQAYAEYKDSGVEWLGEIPSHWDLQRLKVILNERNEKNDPIKSTNILSLTMHQGVIPYSEKEGSGGNKPKEDLTAYKLVYENDIVLNSMNVIVGSVGISRYFGIASLVYYMLYPRNLNQTNIRFYNYIFQAKSFQENLGRLGTGILIKKSESSGKLNTIRMKISMEDLNNEILTIPSVEEQTQIANFLDHETAKIDHLIEKQQQLIELLKEKRQAVISHAVTKGLDPNVPMKDSGVEWLGEVPEHWQLVPLKYLCTFSGGGTPTKDNLSYWTDGNIPWVSPKDMKTFWISETQDYITEKAVKESSTNTVEQNSLLMVVRSGILQRTIPIAINTVPVTMNQDMKALKFGKRVLVEYIANLIHGNTVQLLLEWSKEGATVESIEHEYLANSLIPVPSLKEQEEITQVIAKKMKVYAELTEKAELQITLLQERRTALISAAVTGKIDVRNWQAPMVAEAQTELSA
ncbi:restriction endonuclease subunit S [Acinetobacter radioresistens]|uniref:restriction endonuclease subunit S n=1 Tax=Acinetobacter radioresistens TaxID=40216 RepID=UPI003556BBCD